MGYKRKPEEEKKIARERIETLFKQADEKFSEDKELSNRYVELARKIAMKYKVRMPSKYQKKFCKSCYKYLMPGTNSRVRTRDGKVVQTCLECNHISRHPFVKEQKAKRK